MTTVIIPIRKGSKGVPGKNRRLLNGKPLYNYVLNAALEANLVDKVILATDDDELVNLLNTEKVANSKLIIYRRDDENAKDNSSTESVLIEVIESEKLKNSETIILVQATCPMTTSANLNYAVMKFKSEQFDSLLSAIEVDGFYWASDGISLNYNYKNRPRRQDIHSKTLKETGSFYVSTVKNIMETQNRLNGNIGFCILEPHQAIDIDTENDLKLAANLLKNYVG
jgi:CMP-N-acetylneuraminic acid synthetase